MQKQKGFTIVEVLVALVILTFGIAGVYRIFTLTVGLTYDMTSRLTASLLSQEGIEIVRNIRDNNFITAASWSAGLTGCSAGCQADYTSTALASYDGSFLKINNNLYYYTAEAQPVTAFKRKITITTVPGNSDALLVDSLVTWSYQGKNLSFDSQEYIYNWY
jgi:prepilin-type N-terminal cleavage/methylation domain-containing protein